MSEVENWDCERDKAAGHQTNTSLLVSCRVSEDFLGLSLDGVPVLRVTSLRVPVLDAAQGGHHGHGCPGITRPSRAQQLFPEQTTRTT